MKNFLNLNRKSFLIQFLFILIVVLLFVSSKPQYVSSVTINPKLEQATLISNNGIKLTNPYSPGYSISLYLLELADKESRKEIWMKFLSKNPLACDGAPKIQFYEKTDNSFPVTGHFTVITVKSSCVDFVRNFVTFLSNDVNKRLIDKIQIVENEYLERARQQLILVNENELDELEMFILNRKEILQNVIPLLTDEISLETAAPRSLMWAFRSDIAIPTNRTVAQAELDFLSTITDLKTTTRRVIERTAQIEQHKNKHDFSNSELVRISVAEPETISRTSLFLSIFFVLMILGLGFVHMLLNQFKFHRKNLQ